jgi:hypothetical protein
MARAIKVTDMSEQTVFYVTTDKKGQVFEGYNKKLAYRSYYFYAGKKQTVFMYEGTKLLHSNEQEAAQGKT